MVCCPLGPHKTLTLWIFFLWIWRDPSRISPGAKYRYLRRLPQSLSSKCGPTAMSSSPRSSTSSRNHEVKKKEVSRILHSSYNPLNLPVMTHSYEVQLRSVPIRRRLVADKCRLRVQEFGPQNSHIQFKWGGLHFFLLSLWDLARLKAVHLSSRSLFQCQIRYVACEFYISSVGGRIDNRWIWTGSIKCLECWLHRTFSV